MHPSSVEEDANENHCLIQNRHQDFEVEKIKQVVIMTTTTVEGDQGTNIPHNAEDNDMPKLENPKKNRNACKTFQKHLREEFLVPCYQEMQDRQQILQTTTAYISSTLKVLRMKPKEKVKYLHFIRIKMINQTTKNHRKTTQQQHHPLCLNVEIL